MSAFAERLNAATQLLNAGRVQDAFLIVRDLLVKDQTHPQALYLMGVIFRKSGNFDQAEIYYRASLDRFPHQAIVYNALGALYLAWSRFQECVKASSQAVALDGSHFEAWLNLGLAQYRTGNLEEAEKALRRALHLKPGALPAELGLARVQIASQNFEDAISELKALAVRHPKSAKVHFYLGRAYFEAGQFLNANKAIAKATSLAPDDGDILHEAGRVAGLSGEIKKAVSYLKSAIALAPQHPGRLRDLSKLHYISGERSFLAPYQDALNASPDNITLRTEYAMAALASGGAESAYKTILSRPKGAENSSAYHTAQSHIELGLERWDSAVSSAQKAIQLSPENKLAHQVYTLALLSNGRTEEAVSAARNALILDEADQLSRAYLNTAIQSAGQNTAFDYHSCAAQMDVSWPANFEDHHAFNAALKHRLEDLHSSQQEPLDQSLRGGTQIELTQLARSDELIGQLVVVLKEAVTKFVRSLPQSSTDFWLSQKPERVEFSGIWSVRLRSGGRHVNHVHPQGWLSSAYYVHLPKEVTSVESEAGCLRLGEPPIPRLQGQIRTKTFRPRIGSLVLFPSHMWHGTIPFDSEEDRLTVAFDVKGKQ